MSLIMPMTSSNSFPSYWKTEYKYDGCSPSSRIRLDFTNTLKINRKYTSPVYQIFVKIDISNGSEKFDILAVLSESNVQVNFKRSSRIYFTF